MNADRYSRAKSTAPILPTDIPFNSNGMPAPSKSPVACNVLTTVSCVFASMGSPPKTWDQYISRTTAEEEAEARDHRRLQPRSPGSRLDVPAGFRHQLHCRRIERRRWISMPPALLPCVRRVSFLQPGDNLVAESRVFFHGPVKLTCVRATQSPQNPIIISLHGGSQRPDF